MKNKFYLVIFLFLTACTSERNYNLPDIEDKNRIPAHLENREEEYINQRDKYDENRTPGGLEERENEEERIRIIDEPIF